MPTAFSVTYVNGDFWLVDEDPTNGDQPGWAVAHEATTPAGFNNDLLDAVTSSIRARRPSPASMTARPG